jgi:Cu/Ag efflux pump CusA
MTSFAFILGVFPLAVATGAGAGARNSVGTSVAGGMLASTFLSIFFIPVLYVVIRSIAPGKVRHGASDEARPHAVAEGGAHA